MKLSHASNEPKHRFMLILPVDLYLKVQQMARMNHRSVTGQIISALEWSTREVTLDEPTEPS